MDAEYDALMRYKDQLCAFDIIHTHDWFGLHYKLKVENPKLNICHTHHGHLAVDWWKTSSPPFPLNMFAISDFMNVEQKSVGFPSRTVYNGVDMNKYGYKEAKGTRLLFVGRVDTFKRPEIAIQVAKRLGMGLDIVAGTFVQSDEFMRAIKSECDGEKIRWIEDPSQEEKVRLMQEAMVLISPGKMGEPFGLMNAEAMACGTPVICSDDGAQREVVKHGVTGFVCKEIEDMVDAVFHVEEIKPDVCRKHVQDNFSREVMATNYLNAYSDIIAGRAW
jgi:glycosyltransferase involved in cell wall biosynthesis